MFARIMDWLRRLFRRECHYINGPETLPPPLTREEEETVMNELRGQHPSGTFGGAQSAAGGVHCQEV
jgi:RNA polymerase sporulation-specific sigma factor